jgi:hypothetical protein
MIVTLLTLLVICAAFYAVVLYYAFVGVNKVYNALAGFLSAASTSGPALTRAGKVTGVYKRRQVECVCLANLWKSFNKAWDNFEIRMKTNVDLQLQKGYFMQIRPTINTFAENNWVVYLLNDVGDRQQERLIAALEELCQAAGTYEQQVKDRAHQRCLACGQELGANQDTCPECGWSWKSKLER